MYWHSQVVEASVQYSYEPSSDDIGFKFAFVDPIADSAAVDSKEFCHFFY
jgi:hypothetical protein